MHFIKHALFILLILFSSFAYADNNASALIDKIEGVYKYRFQNLGYNDTYYPSENILEIVRVSNDTIYFKTHLEFERGYQCNLSGIASYKNFGAFVFTKTFDTRDPKNGTCTLRIIPTPKGITLIDNYSCTFEACSAAHAEIQNTFFKASAKRPIRYMVLLKNSKDYQEALDPFKDYSTNTPTMPLPPGSYSQTCWDCSIRNNLLICDCAARDQEVRKSQILYKTCTMPNVSLQNCDGILNCTTQCADLSGQTPQNIPQIQSVMPIN